MTEKNIYEKFALTTSGYADFEGRENEVISQIIAGAPTLADLVPQTGIKAGSSTDLNILTTDVTWSSSDCVSNETGNNTVLKPRNISVVRLSDRELLCLDKLDAKVPQLVKAGAMNDELSFSEAFINLKVKANAKQLEKLAWSGSITGGTTGNLALADGYLEIAKGETADLAHYSTKSASTLSTIITDVRVAINNRTDEMRENGAILYMSSANMSLLSEALVSANLFNYGQVSEDENGLMTFKFPGTNVTVKGTYGITSGDLFMTIEGNLRMGTDMENDKETVELFFSRYNKQLVSDLIFAAGFQYEFASQVILIEEV